MRCNEVICTYKGQTFLSISSCVILITNSSPLTESEDTNARKTTSTMSAPFRYQIIFDTTTCDVGKFTADINTALDTVESYNWNIKVSEAKWRQALQIAANLDNDPGNPTTPRANIEAHELGRERSNLESERQIVLRSIDQAIRCLEQQEETTNNLAAGFAGVDCELHQDALTALAKYKADIAYLQLRRSVVGHTPQTSGLGQDQSSSSGDHISS